MERIPRDTYRFYVEVGERVVHRGCTKNLARERQALRQTGPTGRLVQIGPPTTFEAARQWAKNHGYG